MATRFVASMRNMTVDSETVMLEVWTHARKIDNLACDNEHWKDHLHGIEA